MMTIPVVMINDASHVKVSVELIFISAARGVVTEVAQALLVGDEYSDLIRKGDPVTLKIGSEFVAVRLLDEKDLPSAPINTQPAIVLLENTGLAAEAISVVSMPASENLMCALSVEDAAQFLCVKLVETDKVPVLNISLMPQSATCLSLSAQTTLSLQSVADVMIKSVDILSRRMDIARQIVAQAQKRDNQ